jgi:hypothetical protein
MCIAVRFTLLDIFSTLYPSLERTSSGLSFIACFLVSPLTFLLNLCWAAFLDVLLLSEML